MVGGKKILSDLPEHVFEQIVSTIASDSKDLNKFFAFGLSSKLFYKSTIHILDKNDVYFPIDMNNVKTKSNVTMMKYMSLYDDVSKGKFGLKFVTKKIDSKPKPANDGCKCCGDGSSGDGRIDLWLNECKNLRKIYLDKIDASVPIMHLAIQKLIFQSHETIQIFKFENDGRYPHAIEDELYNRCIRGCENLKDLTIVWNLNRNMDHERALDFKHGVFQIVDNMPGLEVLRIEMPQIVGDKGQEYKNNGEFRYNIVILDLKLRFFYEETKFTPYMPQIVKSLEESRTRKLFSFNGSKFFRNEDCCVHGNTKEPSDDEEDEEEEHENNDEDTSSESSESEFETEEDRQRELERIRQEEEEEIRQRTLRNWW